MSNIALSWAFRCHVGNASAKAVLVYLADRADDDGTAAYPKIATMDWQRCVGQVLRGRVPVR